MTEQQGESPADYMVQLNINGLNGRMLHMPAPKRYNRELLVVYGHHARIERWWGLLQNLNETGAVTMPDLPGFGSMDSFRSIGKEPTIDNFADYLAAFVKLRYKRRRLTIVGISFGFVVATRMLQKYPELAKKVDLVVSIVGFMHRDDFLFTPRQRFVYSKAAQFFALSPIAWIIRYGFLNRFVIRQLYLRLPAGRKRFVELEPTTFESMIEYDVLLWQTNDVHTHWFTTKEFLALDNCRKPIALPVIHIASKHDHYFDNQVVEQHMKVVFNHYEQYTMDSKSHTPHILGNKKEMAIMVPPALKRALRRKV